MIARTYGGKFVFARVWNAFPWAVELTADPFYTHLLQYGRGPAPIPFPREDVFFDSPEARAAVERGNVPGKELLRRYEPVCLTLAAS